MLRSCLLLLLSKENLCLMRSLMREIPPTFPLPFNIIFCSILNKKNLPKSIIILVWCLTKGFIHFASFSIIILRLSSIIIWYFYVIRLMLADHLSSFSVKTFIVIIYFQMNVENIIIIYFSIYNERVTFEGLPPEIKEDTCS